MSMHWSVKSILQIVIERWNNGDSEEDTIAFLGAAEIEDEGIVFDMENEDELFDEARIWVRISPIEYSIVDGRSGVTDLIILHTDPNESSWSDVRLGDKVLFVADVNRSTEYRASIFWRWPGQSIGSIIISAENAKCIRIVEPAPDRAAESPLVPYTGEKNPQIVDGSSVQLLVKTDNQIAQGISAFWEQTLDALPDKSKTHTVEIWLRHDYSSIQSFDRDSTARRIKLRQLVNVEMKPMIRGFLAIDYTIDQYHHEWLTRLAEGLSFSPVSDRLAEFGSSLTIVAAVTDDFDKREFIQLWPATDESVANKPDET